jgi:ABC-type branched-subunit amino acid transport system ATPase component
MILSGLTVEENLLVGAYAIKGFQELEKDFKKT